ncbi:MAG: RDD family protein [Planctomycetota bacterium]
MPSLLPRRLAAFGLDCALLFAVLAPTSWALQWALGVQPDTGAEIWYALLLGFSLPAWLYFIVLDSAPRRGTLGKRVFGLRVVRYERGAPPAVAQTPVSLACNAWRCLLKLAPWELVHISAFALSERPDELTLMQMGGLVLANLLALAGLIIAGCTRGRRALHDLAVGTSVADTRGAGADTRP